MSNLDPLTPAPKARVDNTPVPQDIAKAIRATRLQFSALGVISGFWGVHIPSVKDHYGLSEVSLALLLMAAAVGALTSLLFAGRLIGSWGARRSAVVAAAIMGASLAQVLHWPGTVALLLAMLLFGAAGSVLDVAINTEGSALEAIGQRPIMGSLHGMFSLGGMVGAATAGFLLRAGWTASAQLLLVGMLVAVSVAIQAWHMLPVHPSTEADAAQAHFAWPRGTLLVIGLLIFAGMCAEGVMYDWCVLYLQQEVQMPQAQAAWGYAAFAAAMAAMRFTADRLRTRYSERLLLRSGAITTAVSMALVLLAADPWFSIVGYALVGAGLAQVVPILYNAATRVPGTTRAAAIAAVSSIGYAGFMVGPPLIGGIAHASSLTMAMGVIVVAAIALAVWAHRVPDKA